MRAEYLRKLQSPLRGERMRAWSELHVELAASHGSFTPEDWCELHQILRMEEDDGVMTQATIEMLGATGPYWMTAPGAPFASPAHPPPEGSPKVRTLDDWFLQLFRRPSAVLGTSEAHLRRDEDALAQVARRFSPEEFPQTDLRSVPLGDDSWFQLLVDHRYETILVIGRLWMFGQKALENLEDGNLHLRFPQRIRPGRLERGRIDKKYHCIHEHNGNGRPEVHATKDIDGSRIDYGVVQVYPAFNGRSWITVVLCAGCSSLGTLGAARWLAYDLWRPHRGQGSSPIPAPQGTNTDSRMEVLIRITAKSTPEVWRPEHIELHRLYFDKQIWSPGDSQWQLTTPHQIEIRLRRDEPVTLMIDGQRVNMQQTSQSFRLAAALVMAVASSPDGSASVNTLARNKSIWSGQEMPACTTRQRLHTLDARSLNGLILFDGDKVRLDGEVHVRQV